MCALLALNLIVHFLGLSLREQERNTVYFRNKLKKMKFAANLTMMFQEAGNLIKRYEAAANYGFRYVECAFPYEESLINVKNIKEKYNLQQVIINTPIGTSVPEDKGFACLPNKISEFRSSLDTAILYAKGLNCNRIHVMSGKFPPDAWKDAEKTYLENIQYAADLCNKENIVCLIEPINPVSIPGYFLNSYEQAFGYLQKLSHPNLKLQLDIFHLQMICGNLTNNIKRSLPFTGHIQIAQAPHRHEPNSSGEINYEYIFDVLRTSNYDQFIGCEYIPAADTVAGLQWLKQYNIHL